MIVRLSTVDQFCFLQVDRIIFCVFLEVDYKIFKKKMGEFFPLGRYSNQLPSDFKKTRRKKMQQLPSFLLSKAKYWNVDFL